VNRREAAYRALGAVFVVPTLVSMPVLSVVWTALYQGRSGEQIGPISALLALFRVEPQAWLAQPQFALPAIALMSIWQGVGLQTLVFFSGLQAIPRETIEAASLDGAGAWRRLIHITLPSLRNTTIFVVTVTTIWSLRLFVQPYLMTHGGPAERTLSVTQWIYECTFIDHEFGRASAASVLLLLAVFSLVWLQRRSSKEDVA